jgi:hypothetical protein
MAALIIHGIVPGPPFLLSGVLPYTVFAGLLLAQASFLLSGLLLARPLSRVVYMPNAILAPIIVVLCFLGAYAERNYVFDIAVMLGFGLLSYGCERVGYPVVCMVLGLILGPIIESNFHRSLGIGFGSYRVFTSRPITVAMFLLTALFLASPYLVSAVRQKGASEDATRTQLKAVAGTGELCVLLPIGVLLAVFLYEARGYGPAARLFPVIATVSGLTLVLARLVGLKGILLGRGWRLALRNLGLRHDSDGGLVWYQSMALMIGYLLLTYLIGSVVAGAVYLVAASLLMGYRRKPVVFAVAALSVVLSLGFAKAVGIVLPQGILFR